MKVVVCEKELRLFRFLQKRCRGVKLFSLREAPRVCDILVAGEAYFPAARQFFPISALFVGGEEVFRRMAAAQNGIPPFESLVFCGMKGHHTLLFSSLREQSGLLCLQRSVVFRGEELPIGEYPVDIFREGSLYENLVCSFIRLCQGMCGCEKDL